MSAAAPHLPAAARGAGRATLPTSVRLERPLLALLLAAALAALLLAVLAPVVALLAKSQ